MKAAQIFSCLIFFCFLSIACSKNQRNEEITVQFNAKSTVIVGCENTLKEHLVWGKYQTSLPNKDFTTDTLTINKTKNAFLNFNVNMPLEVDLIIDDSIQLNLLLIPNDTLFVSALLSDSDGSFFDVKYKGKCSSINEYEFQKNKNLSYELNQKRNTLFYSDLLLSDFENSMDSLKAIEQGYFNDFKAIKDLPDWFLKYETNRIYYGTASRKFQRRIYHKNFLNKDIVLPQKSEDFVYQTKIDNKDAIFNNDYYNFFSQYTSLMLPDSIKGIDFLDDRLKALVPYDLKFADSLLTGEQRDIYKSRIISLYLIDQDIIGFADSIIANQKNIMSSKYFNFLQDVLAAQIILEPGLQPQTFIYLI